MPNTDNLKEKFILAIVGWLQGRKGPEEGSGGGKLFLLLHPTTREGREESSREILLPGHNPSNLLLPTWPHLLTIHSVLDLSVN